MRSGTLYSSGWYLICSDRWSVMLWWVVPQAKVSDTSLYFGEWGVIPHVILGGILSVCGTFIGSASNLFIEQPTNLIK